MYLHSPRQHRRYLKSSRRLTAFLPKYSELPANNCSIQRNKIVLNILTGYGAINQVQNENGGFWHFTLTSRGHGPIKFVAAPEREELEQRNSAEIQCYSDGVRMINKAL